jgi:hypothetical protein
VALVRVPFYFINLLPTSLLYISVLLRNDQGLRFSLLETLCQKVGLFQCRSALLLVSQDSGPSLRTRPCCFNFPRFFCLKSVLLLVFQHSMAVTKGISKLPGSDFLDSVIYRPRTIKASGPVLRGVEPVKCTFRHDP